MPNVNKYHILRIVTRNQKFQYEVNGIKFESITIASSLRFSQQCKGAAAKADRILGFINKNFSFKNKHTMHPLYISLVRSHLKYAVQFWSPHHSKDIGKLEAVQRRAANVITSLRNKPYEKRLPRLILS